MWRATRPPLPTVDRPELAVLVALTCYFSNMSDWVEGWVPAGLSHSERRYARTVASGALVIGVLFTLWTKGSQWRSMTEGIRVLRGKGGQPAKNGAIRPFQALSAALSATVGLGNIGGVALAISLGGPGAVFQKPPDQQKEEQRDGAVEVGMGTAGRGFEQAHRRSQED